MIRAQGLLVLAALASGCAPQVGDPCGDIDAGDAWGTRCTAAGCVDECVPVRQHEQAESAADGGAQ